MKDYIFSKHGLYCCDIVTFNTVADKGAIRDVARALNIPLDTVSIICESVDDENEYEKSRKKYPELFKYVDLIKGTIVSVGSHPCFPADTLVKTENGFKKISDIKVGDKVFTHHNRYESVVEIMSHVEKEDLYEIKAAGSIPIISTYNHPYYVRECVEHRIRHDEYNINSKTKTYNMPLWKEAKDIKVGDMLGIPINQESVIPVIDGLNTHLKSFWWIIGRYIGDGWCTQPKGRTEKQVIICCDNHGTEEILDIIKHLISVGFDYRIENRKSVYRIYIKNNILFDYLQNYGKYADGKYLYKDVMHLPVDMLHEFLNGYCSADGCYIKANNEFCYTTVSKELALNLVECIGKVYHTFARINIQAAGKDIIEGRIVNRKEKFRVFFNDRPKKGCRSFYENGYIWSRCVKINVIENTETMVYNLSVQNDNSYTVNNIAVHNCGLVCAPFSVTDRFGTFTTSTSNYPISQINMKEIDSLNYVKLDLLRLDTIELINETCKLAGIERLTPDNVDITDVRVWNEIRDDTTQIFQWEGNTGDSYIKKLLSDDNIKKFQAVNENIDRMTLLSIGNSAIRPAGASYRDDLANGVVRLTGSKPIDEFLSNTFGYLVFQCQIIEFLHVYCGFTMGEADIVRRGFAKKTGTDKYIPIIKDGGYMTDKKDHYIKGFITTMKETYGIDESKSEEDIVAFIKVIEDASSYLFSLNHSQPYSYEGYVSGYLRTYYPVEFLTVALNINKDKEEKTRALTMYAKNKKIIIKPPRFRYSQAGYLPDSSNNAIYKGIGSIKYMNEKIANELYELKDNQYNDFVDLLYDIEEKTTLNSRQLDILIKIDFFEEFGDINKLLLLTHLFSELYGKRSIRLDKLSDLGLEESLVGRYSEVSTETRADEIDCEKYIRSLGIIDVETELSDCIRYRYEPDSNTMKRINEELEYAESLPDDSDELLNVRCRIKEIEKAGVRIKIPNGYSSTKVIKKYNMTTEEQLQFAKKVVVGRFDGINLRGILKEVNRQEIEKCSLAQRIKYQISHLGYVEYLNSELANTRFIAVTGMDDKYSPRFEAYCLKNGQVCEMRVHKKRGRMNKDVKVSFADLPFEDGDILYMKECKKKPKQKKSEDGSWVAVPNEYNWWITDYMKVENI